MKNKAIIVSENFNPIRKGRLWYFNNAKSLADEFFLIVNNDYQRMLKRSKEFQKEDGSYHKSGKPGHSTGRLGPYCLQET